MGDAFDNGVFMLCNMSAPFLNALDDKLDVGVSRNILHRMQRFHRGKNTFFCFIEIEHNDIFFSHVCTLCIYIEKERERANQNERKRVRMPTMVVLEMNK